MISSILILSLALVGCVPNNDESSSGDIPGGDNISSQSNSVTSSEDENVNDLSKQADVLAEHIAIYSVFLYNLTEDNPVITEISDVEIYRFIASTFIFAGDENHPYNDIAKKSIINKNGNAIYTLDNTQNMAYQLFGKKKFLAQGKDSDNSYDEVTKTYIISTQSGFGNNVASKKVISTQNEDTIETEISLVNGTMGENVSEKYGTFNIAFDIINENNNIFLRFKEISIMIE